MTQQRRPWLFGRRGLFRSTFAVGALSLAPSSLDRVNADSIQSAADALDAGVGRELEPYADVEHSAFMHGVASGDPLPTSVILWTRVTPSPEAVPGSGVGADITVRWEVATDPGMRDVVRSGEVAATAATDHTVHVDPHGLEPGTRYFFRFGVLEGELAGSVSPVGRMRTAPAEDSDPRQLRLAVTSCANFEAGYFAAYTGIAEAAARDEIDVVIHMGDYLYEYASGAYPGKNGITRTHVPTWEITSLADYRARYGNYRRDTELQAAHAAAPWVVTWDDHEFANDTWADGAGGHTPLAGAWSTRRDAAMQAYLEWLPVRGAAPSRGGKIYRTLRFGTLAELHMLDLRSYRSRPATPRPGGLPPTMMGSEQFDWLSSRLATADTRWNLIGTSVMMAPLNMVSLEASVKGPLATMTGAAEASTAEGERSASANPDQWDGYAADRTRLLARIAEHHPEGRTVFVTGDIHSEWANHVVYDRRVVAAELVTTSVTARNLDDILLLPEDSLVAVTAENHIRSHNPHVAHVDLDAHGFAVLTVTRDDVRMRWMRVDDIYTRGSGVSPGPAAVYDGREITL